MKSNFKRTQPTSPDPTEVAVEVLAWLASDSELLARFLALTGVEPEQIRRAASDPGFMSAMLDFIMAHEPTALEFCAASGRTPEDLTMVWRHFCKPGLDSGEY